MSTAAERMAHAREVRSEKAAARAVDDPRRLQQAARIVKQALARKALSPDDVMPDEAA